MKTQYSDRILLLLTLLLLGCFLHVTAQPVQKITPAKWHQLTDDKALNYKNDRELVAPQADYNQGAFQKAIIKFISFLFGPAGALMMWVLVIGLVVFVIYKLAVGNGSFMFARNKKISGSAIDQGQENEDIEATNWDKLLQQAMAANDTRMAVRYRYMWLLQLLQQASLIQYRNDKTNYDNYTELHETQYRQPFKQLSRLYEYAWYGNFTLSSAAYNDYLAHFDHLKNQLAA
jgi:hypothetical protein